MPAAYALSRFCFRGREAVDSIREFPIIVSPAALGAIILIFFSNPLGQWIQMHTITFVFAFPGIVLAQFITVLGVFVRFLKTALDQVPRRYATSACIFGASPSRAFLTVDLPFVHRGLIGAGVLSWPKPSASSGRDNGPRHHGDANRDAADCDLQPPLHRRHRGEVTLEHVCSQSGAFRIDDVNLGVADGESHVL